jgi:predicted RNA-binding Zn-ribbon protein involved in translation (DUF1610 family)
MDAPDSLVNDTSTGKNEVEERLEEHCLNCGAILTGAFCAQCGQKNIGRRQTLSELGNNFISSFAGYDSKFLLTCKHLLLKPGFLPMEYNAGRRERYFHPVRMYAFISVIYFFLFATLPGADKSGGVLTITKDGQDVSSFASDSLDLNNAFETREHYDSVQAALPPDDRDNWFERKLQYKAFDLKDQASDNPGEFAKHVGEGFTSHVSVIFFLLLPIFAAILWMLNYKKDIYFSEHLVFSICYYNFFFLAGSVALLLESIPWLNWISILLGFAIMLYLLLAMKRNYRDGWGKTVLKFVSFTVAFGICILIGLLVNLLITLMLI